MVTAAQEEVLLLRPTREFYKLVNNIVNPHHVPSRMIDRDLFNVDSTAYIIPYREDPKEAAALLEQLYQKMFTVELSRWVQDIKTNNLHLTFFDFHVCFNLNYHRHVLGMGKMGAHNHVLVLKPTPAIKDWMRASLGSDEKSIAVLDKTDIDRIAENSTLVIKDFNELSEVGDFVKQHAKAIFEFELKRMCSDETLWPKQRDFDSLQRFYNIEIHTQLVNLLH